MCCRFPRDFAFDRMDGAGSLTDLVFPRFPAARLRAFVCMSTTEISGLRDRAAIEPLPAEIKSTQPGGGVCYRIELAWGRWRRWVLKTFNRGYVRRMRELRRGEPTGCPHEMLDPARSEILPQSNGVSLGRGRRSVCLARADSFRPLGTGRIADHGLAAVGGDGGAAG